MHLAYFLAAMGRLIDMTFQRSIVTLLASSLFIFSPMTQAQTPPSQSDLLKNSIFGFFTNLGETVKDCVPHLMGNGPYDVLTKDHPAFFEKLKDLIGKNRLPRADLKNLPVFSNSEEYFSDVCDFEFALCMGISTAIRKINMLAIFDPTNSLKKTIPSGEDARIRYYARLLKTILVDNEPAVIPGISSLRELSDSVLSEKEFRKEIVQLWAKKNGSMTGLRILMDTDKPATAAEINAGLPLIREALKRNYNPLISLAKVKTGSNHWIHILQVLDMTEDKDLKTGSKTITLKVWDPNYLTPIAVTRKIVIEISSTGDTKIGFGPWNQSNLPLTKDYAHVARVEWDQLEVGEMLLNLMNFCKKSPEACSLMAQN